MVADPIGAQSLNTGNNAEGRNIPNTESVMPGWTVGSSPGDEQRQQDVPGRARPTDSSPFAQEQRDGPFVSGVPWTSDDIYDWLPGGSFLLHHWDALPVRKNP